MAQLTGTDLKRIAELMDILNDYNGTDSIYFGNVFIQDDNDELGYINVMEGMFYPA